MDGKFDKVKYDREYTKEHYSDIRIQVKKDDEIKQRLKRACFEMNQTQNKLIYTAIDEYLKKNGY